MREQIEVVYENGVLRPLGPVSAQLHERERYTVILEGPTGEEGLFDTECMAAAARDGNPEISIEEVRRALAKVQGSLADHIQAEREVR